MKLALTLLVSITISLGLLELGVRIISPQVYGPKLTWNPQFGFVPSPNSIIPHKLKNKFHYKYKINSKGFRGTEWLIDKETTVVLGDSYSFGQGVSEGSQFSALIKQKLPKDKEIINLSSPGWGLTQQIRAYYQIAKSYQPKTVILQYASNDPFDNYHFPVTKYEDSKFTFSELTPPTYIRLVPKIIRDILYEFHSYQFFRLWLTKKIYQSREPAHESIKPEQENYLRLFKPFLNQLLADGTKVIFLYHGPHMDEFPQLLEYLKKQPLTLVNASELFIGEGPFDSPDGHEWGVKGHQLIAQRILQLSL